MGVVAEYNDFFRQAITRSKSFSRSQLQQSQQAPGSRYAGSLEPIQWRHPARGTCLRSIRSIAEADIVKE